MKKKFNIRDIYHKDRPLSWSAISSWEFSPEQWYDKYVCGIKQESKEMAFGFWVDTKLQVDPLFLPQVERYPIMQHGMRVSFDGIPLIGYADGWDPDTLRLKDDKTGKKKWDKKRADETGQLTCYAFLLYLTEKIKPQDLQLYISWLPTVENGDFSIGFRDDPVVPVVLHTSRTMLDILQFGGRIKTTLALMEAYAQSRIDAGTTCDTIPKVGIIK